MRAWVRRRLRGPWCAERPRRLPVPLDTRTDRGARGRPPSGRGGRREAPRLAPPELEDRPPDADPVSLLERSLADGASVDERPVRRAEVGDHVASVLPPHLGVASAGSGIG